MKRYKTGAYGAMIEDVKGPWVTYADALAAPRPQLDDVKALTAEWGEAVYHARENWTVSPHEHIERLITVGDALLAALAAPRPQPDEDDRIETGPQPTACGGAAAMPISGPGTPGVTEGAELGDGPGVASEGVTAGETALLLRRHLWVNHGCPVSSLYGDDGEMQCNATRVHAPIDFKREALPDLVRVVVACLKAAAPRPSGEPDGSVRVRVAPPYLEQMRGDGLVGPFSRIRLLEDEEEPRLELTVDPTPTPDTVEWWRSVAQELATEIHKLKGLAQTSRPSGEREARADLVALVTEIQAVVAEESARGVAWSSRQQDLMDRLLAWRPSPPGERPSCQWTEDEDGVWHTGCGRTWFFESGGVEENRQTYCMGCGHPVAAAPFIEGGRS